ncbi:hypothetical protein [Pseudomonas graminis]|uniref:hypothetical protein n=1 Tax=Pseudomonas graminis TaxID=158627 RepID=UPI00114CE010|nr:hypothetical protein [Pseudomonas graminis]
MEPAVQGALVGATAAIIGVISSGAIQWGLKISEESRRKQETAELIIFYCRRLRSVLRKLGSQPSLSSHLALGISINDDDVGDLDYVLKELGTKIPQLALIAFDIKRALKNVQSYSNQYWDLLASLKNGTGNPKDLPVIESWLMIDARQGSIQAHNAIQLSFEQLTKPRKKIVIHKVRLDDTYSYK